MDAVNVWAKFEVRTFTRSWDNNLNNFGQSLNTPTLPFLHNFECAFVRKDTVNLAAKFEVRSYCFWAPYKYSATTTVLLLLRVPEIIRGTLKLWAVPGYAVH